MLPRLDQAMQFARQHVKSWIIPGLDDYNCTGFNATAKGPSALEFLHSLETYQAVLIGLASLLTFATSSFAIVECWYVYKNVVLENRRNKLYFLITLFPVSMILCLIGMLMPRVGPLATSAGMFYFLLCLFVLVSLIRHLKNGRHELSKDLLVNEKRINFQSPPLCCFCFWLPEAKPTLKNLRLLEFIVLQAPIVRACVLFIEATIMIEKQQEALFEIQLCEFASIVSTMLAIFGVHTLARLVSDQLSAYGFIWVFRIVDISLLFFSAQHPIIFQNILLRFKLLGCGPVLTPPANALFISNFVLICELFLLSMLGVFTTSPSRNKMFDGYTIAIPRMRANGRDEDAESLTDTTITTTSLEEPVIVTQPISHPTAPTVDCRAECDSDETALISSKKISTQSGYGSMHEPV